MVILFRQCINRIHIDYSVCCVVTQSRRSMVFSKQLRDVGDEFRKQYLDSDDESDKTMLENWQEMKVSALVYTCEMPLGNTILL